MANLVFDFLHHYQTGEMRASDPADAYQYDEGHVMEAVVPVAVTSCEIHYWVRGMDEAEAYVPTSITPNQDGSYTILGNIPNSYFETYGDLRVYIVVTDGTASITTYEGRIHICERSKPDDYVDDDPDNDATRVLNEAREAAATATAAAETCEEVLESIPADYSQLSDDVDDLKDGLSDVEAQVTAALVTDTASGAIASFPDGADGVPVKSLTVDIEPVQSGSGDPSPTNIRPISGHTSAVVTVSPTTDAQDGTSYTIDLDGTRYGGTLNVTTGVLTVDRQIVDLGTLTWILNGGYFKSSSLDSIIKRPVSNTEVPQVICSIYYPVNWNTTADKSVSVLPATGSAHNIFLWVKDSSYTDAESFTSAMNGVQLCYTLATPFTVQLTAQEVTTLKGQNNIWADTGDVEVEYRADTKLYINKVLNA